MRIYRHLTANGIRLEPFPFVRELAMEAYLLENEEVLALDDDSFAAVEIVDAELTLKLGRKSQDTDGRIDILATYSQEWVAVIELKLGELNDLHLTQLEDYLLQKEQILAEYPDVVSSEVSANPKWIGVLVGATIAPPLSEKLKAGYTTQAGVPIAALTVQRFRGADGSVLVTTDSHFSYKSGSKDYTKYKFDGMDFGKSALVLAVIRHHIGRNPSLTLAELQRIFPKALQGSRGVVASADEANEIYQRTGRKRHFLNPEDLVAAADSRVAVSTQWGVKNIGRFIEKAKSLGYEIHPV